MRARELSSRRAVARAGGSARTSVSALLLFLGLTASMPGCGAADSDDQGAGGATTAGRGGSGGTAGAGAKDGGTAGATGGSGASGGSGGASGSAGAGAGNGGTAGKGGASGTGGIGGSAGSAGSGGTGGIAGSGGNAGTGAPDSGRSGSDAGGASGSGGSAGSDAGTSGDGRTPVDAGVDGADGSSPDSVVCTPVDPRDSTITAYQTDIIGRLCGQTDITPGVKLTNRATVANRQTARDYLKKLFQDLTLTPLEHNYGSGTNVYAQLPSTSGGTQSVVFGAHYDTVMIAPGANDNATGVAAVYAVARYATKLPCRSKSLIFALFDEEESGLIGSKQFAAKLKSDGTAVHSVHTIDQMGWDQDGDRAIELELPDTGLRELYEAAATKLAVTIPMKSTTTGSTDHASFRPTFLAIGLTEEYTSGDTTPYYHKAGDTFDTVNFAYLLSTTVLVNQVVADLTR